MTFGFRFLLLSCSALSAFVWGCSDRDDDEPCDTQNPDSCGPGLVCEFTSGGEPECYEPVLVVGRIFDFASRAPVTGAVVGAADANGAAASDNAMSDAQGRYVLRVSVARQSGGDPAPGTTISLRASAQGFEVFPRGVRVALPIDVPASVSPVEGSGLVIENASTDVGLLALPEAAERPGSISGTVRSTAPGPGGTLVVADDGNVGGVGYGWADRTGDYTIFNVRPGTYSVNGYLAGVQYEPVETVVDEAEQAVDVDLSERRDVATGVVNGSVSLVNPGECDGTSVVLVPVETWDARFSRGEAVAGLRSPAPGIAPDVRGAWSIDGVPDGTYAVLAGFENDRCVRDLDPAIAGTQVQFVTIPDPDTGSRDVAVPESFKVTGALAVIAPGAEGADVVAASPEFSWEDDSSEDRYHVVVYDAFGNEVWRREDVDGVQGSNATLSYDGPGLVSGMIYQFRVTSLRRDGTVPISQTEDLLGVFEVR